jgi:hypothetical protein
MVRTFWPSVGSREISCASRAKLTRWSSRVRSRPKRVLRIIAALFGKHGQHAIHIQIALVARRNDQRRNLDIGRVRLQGAHRRLRCSARTPRNDHTRFLELDFDCAVVEPLQKPCRDHANCCQALNSSIRAVISRRGAANGLGISKSRLRWCSEAGQVHCSDAPVRSAPIPHARGLSATSLVRACGHPTTFRPYAWNDGQSLSFASLSSASETSMASTPS